MRMRRPSNDQTFSLVTAPVQALAALLIKISSPGPVFFRQVRCGLNGRHFTLLKFRTMDLGAQERLHEVSHLNEMSGPVFKVSRDPRLTPVGRLLRRLSIDELPQLWNVILGDMSLVGPRPPLPEEVQVALRINRHPSLGIVGRVADAISAREEQSSLARMCSTWRSAV